MSAATFRESSFRDKAVLVSGGTSGIGAAIGEAFCALGARVTVTGATEEEAAAARARTGGALERALALDVRDGAAIAAFVATLSRLDVLVNCAGIIRRGEEHDPEVFDAVLDVNLGGTMRLCTATRSLLAATSGCIVNTASMLSFFGAALVPKVQREQRWRGAAYQVARLRVCFGRHPRRRDRSGLDRDGADAPAAGRSHAHGDDPFAHAARPVGKAGGCRGRRRIPVLAGRGIHHRRGPSRRRRLSRRMKPWRSIPQSAT